MNTTVSLPSPIAIVTVKETGKVAYVYSVASESGETYSVWVHKGVACHCSCKSRKYRKYTACKHMRQFQALLNAVEQQRQAEQKKRDQETLSRQLAKPAPAMTPDITTRGALNGNRPFSILKQP
jgi:hypothetical protein